MPAFSIGFMMDVAILVLLAGTVFFVFRLNASLREFKESRGEMEGLVNRLTSNIERAEKAIAGLQVSARNSGADLDKKIKESKFLSDELKFMNEAGDALAARLEKLADRNRELVQKMEENGGIGPASSSSSSAIESTIVVREQAQAAPKAASSGDIELGFMIQDRDFDDDFHGEDIDDLEFELESGGAGLQSQAEREFFEALQKRKSAGGRN